VGISVRVHEHEVDALFSPAGPVWSELEQTVNRGVNYSREFCPVDEGRLRQSIRGRIEARGHALVGSWGSDLEYATYRHEGTGIYGPRRRRITPKRGQFLVFESSGTFGPVRAGKKDPPAKGKRPVVFARSVRGVPPSPFLTDALALVMPGVPVRKHVTQ
jgi:hypothetical protein